MGEEGFSTWGGEGQSHCLTHLPLRLRLLVLLLATGRCVERTWHTAHHRRGPPRAPGGVIGTIELQGAEGEVSLRAHARHPMQTKGVLLPLGQQPGGTGVGSSRVKQCSCLFAHNPPPSPSSTVPQLFTIPFFFFFPNSLLHCPPKRQWEW